VAPQQGNARARSHQTCCSEQGKNKKVWVKPLKGINENEKCRITAGGRKNRKSVASSKGGEELEKIAGKKEKGLRTSKSLPFPMADEER